MKILCLEPYFGGSHKAFLTGWIEHSSHEWTLLTLPPHKWKWRMRHAAITFAQQAGRQIKKGQTPDIIFCSDMLNLAEFLGLADNKLKNTSAVVYFHENQLTYPVQFESERDYQFVMTNMTTALAADEVWFNSAFHRDEFLSALTLFLKRMPDNQPVEAVERIRAKSQVYRPGINKFPARKKRNSGHLRILWAARWEHDKNPEDFFAALKQLKEKNIDFRLSVIGEQFRDGPEIFDWAKEFFADHIDRWGHQRQRSQYEAALAEADVIISTANHEFFGITIAEAIAAGAFPLLPQRLAYPEIAGNIETKSKNEFFYNGTVDSLVERLTQLAELVEQKTLWAELDDRGVRAMEKFSWQKTAAEMDNALEIIKK